MFCSLNLSVQPAALSVHTLKHTPHLRMVVFISQVKSPVDRVELHALELWVTLAEAVVDGGSKVPEDIIAAGFDP